MKNMKKSLELDSIPSFSEHDLLLPPIRSRKHSPTTATGTNTTSTISPRHKNHLHMFNKGGSISFGRSPRFSSDKREHPDSYSYNANSDFDSGVKKRKGPSIGISDRSDFTKASQINPGAGRY